MNTRKQVLIMSALLMMMLLIVAVYAAWYPSRATDAESKFEDSTAERGAILFARNCRLCHGDVAQGGSLGARLPAAPALNRPDLQGFVDSTATLVAEINPTVTTLQLTDTSKLKPDGVLLLDEERMHITAIDGNNVTVERAYAHTAAAGHFKDAQVWAFDNASYKTKVSLITNTITCGRVGSAMPAWSDQQGGPLSDEQIRQLMTLITTARWDLVQTEDNSEDKINAHLTQPLAADAASSFVDSHTALTSSVDNSQNTIEVENGSLLKVGQTILVNDERMAITKIDGNKISVTRAANKTTAAAHGSGTAVKLFKGAEMHVNDVTVFSAGDAIRMGDERLRVMVVPTLQKDAKGQLPKDKSGVLEVDRGILGTFPIDHSVDDVIYKFPETSEPSTNQASCGQIAKAAAPSGTPGLIEPFTGQTVEVTAQNIAFNTSKITVNAGGQIRIRLTNNDAGTPHNFAVYKSATDTTPVSDGSVGIEFPGPDTDDTVFAAPAKGTYYFRCDVHPTIMFGTFVVQ
jgi:plastocyanin/uncharacterized Zn finger protein